MHNSYKRIFTLVFGLVCFMASQAQLAPPILNCVNSAAGSTDDLFLSWDLPTNSCGPFVSYEIWAADNPLGPFSQISTITDVNQDTFIHVDALSASTTWCYYMQSNFACPGEPADQSPVVCNTFEVPAYESINVTDTGIILTWDTAANPQVSGYVIAYLLPNGNPVPLDTVFGLTNTTYFDTLSNINDPSLAYTLFTLNDCGATSNSNSIPFSPIFINPDSEVDRCDREIQLEWQPFRSPYGQATFQQVWVSVNGQPDTLLATLDSLRSQFNYFDFNDGDSLVFEVRALALDDSSFVANSAHFVVEASIVQPPNVFYITNATVQADGTVLINWTIDSTAELTFYSPQSGLSPADYETIERFNVPSPLLHEDQFVDSTALTDVNDYYYRILAEDSCNTDHFSTQARTIHLEGQQEDFFVNGLRWNAFEIDSGVVNTYRLYRDFGAGYSQIASFAPADRTYEDDISEFFRQTNPFCYYVEADFNLTQPNGEVLSQTSRSNVRCFTERPVIYIPNAFNPNGLNSEFKPTIFLSDVNDFTMQIFNRWGEKIYETNDFANGWNGTNNGSLVPVGGYPYIIEFVANDGTPIQRKGIVAVVH